ncbi:MAG: hypothetical protein NC097_03135 [Clostridium sp.]|nr:nitrilase family protein [Prevotella sp.]MCM1428770.1 hypothetical protein [Clostridium sp.]MCM1475145.1 nitrilase family protein [Muribaculaceae bacterium]
MLDKNLNVCLFPMEITWENKEENLSKLEEAMNRIHPATDLVIIPETFSTGFITGDKEHVRSFAERNTGHTIEFLKQMSSKHNMAIAGTYIADTGGSLYNRAFFIEPGGDETFADKKHLFTMAGEDKVFSHGHSRMKIRYRGWNLAMVVCYDIRFPIWCRNVDNEYDALICVANWPIARVAAWNQLLIGRAIENEAYVCGVDCKGTDTGGFLYNGDSAVIDFKGKRIDTCSSVEEFQYAVLDREKLDSFRKKFPAWRDADKFTIMED